MIDFSNYSSVIFDMDGVIVNNHKYHLRAWEMFCNKYGYEFDIKTFSERFFGKSNHEILQKLAGNEISKDESEMLGEEKEQIYRDLYIDEIKPLDGLVPVLEKIKENGVTTAIASSAPLSNIDFVLDSLNIRDYFDVIVDASMVEYSKPNPAIYLRAASILNVEPSRCLVFEDSHSGIKAAIDAGMDVIAVATTHSKEELSYNLRKIINFSDLA
ncbi:MAG: beta-phosphoglucomutase family hydrolase [Bacteroidales bacterium]|nr:MAG: beta-phosphoglucomutase family hydrolase [Bacteroidales bacterium]